MAKGYMVFEDGGTSPIAYGASEEWFSDYDDAIKYAMDIVNRRVEELKSHIDRNSVIVYEADDALKNQSHSVPGGRKVVFYWTNYYKR